MLTTPTGRSLEKAINLRHYPGLDCRSRERLQIVGRALGAQEPRCTRGKDGVSVHEHTDEELLLGKWRQGESFPRIECGR